MISIGSHAANRSSFTAIALEPTLAYLKSDDGSGDRRMARLLFKGGYCNESVAVEIEFGGATSQLTFTPKDSTQLLEIALPGAPIDKPTELHVKLTATANTFYASATVKPARKIDIYLMPHSHVDIGYTDLQEKVLQLHIDNIDYAIGLCEKTASYPEGARFVWNPEVMWVIDKYIDRADEAKKKRFWNAVDKGWIALDGCYANINTSNVNTQALLRSFDNGESARRHTGPLSSMYQGDIPGATWGLSATAHLTGLKYFLLGVNPSDRVGFIRPELENKPFYWQSPSGGQKVLFYQCHPYNIGYTLKGSMIPNIFTTDDPRPHYTGDPMKYFLNPYIFGYLDKMNQDGFPYDMMMMTWGMSDNSPLDPELPDVVKQWNERFASPRFIISSAHTFFSEFERRYADCIPTVSGDMTEYWTDGVGSGAYHTAINRNAAEKLQQTETLWALRQPSKYPAAAMDRAWEDVLLFAEHTWGAYNSTSDPEKEFVKEQWRYKSAFAEGAKRASDSLLRCVTTEGALSKVEVFNTTAFKRTDLVTLTPEQSRGKDMVLSADGRTLPSQRLASGELVFVVNDIAPLSSSIYALKSGVSAAVAVPVEGNSIENEFYTLEVDSRDGTISRLYDKRSGRTIIGADTLKMNEYLYLSGAAQDHLARASTRSVRVVESGELLRRLEIVSEAEGCNSLVIQITLVAGVDRVDIKNVVDKQAIRNKEGIHFAFPFAVPQSVIHYDIPAAYVTAEAEQMAAGCRNWFTTGRWVNISNSEYGVNWSSIDAPLMEIGGLTANILGGAELSGRWIREVQPSSTILSWALNNHWHTNFRADQQGLITFRYAISAHDGGFDALGSNAFGICANQPLIAARATSSRPMAELFSLDGAKGTYISHVKPTRDGKGYILTLINTATRGEDVTLITDKSVYTTTIEEGRGDLQNGPIAMGSRGVVLLRVE